MVDSDQTDSEDENEVNDLDDTLLDPTQTPQLRSKAGLKKQQEQSDRMRRPTTMPQSDILDTLKKGRVHAQRQAKTYARTKTLGGSQPRTLVSKKTLTIKKAYVFKSILDELEKLQS